MLTTHPTTTLAPLTHRETRRRASRPTIVVTEAAGVWSTDGRTITTPDGRVLDQWLRPITD